MKVKNNFVLFLFFSLIFQGFLLFEIEIVSAQPNNALFDQLFGKI